MYINIVALDKYGLQVLGNCYGQAYYECKDYKRTTRYKQVKAGVFAHDRIAQYEIYACETKYDNTMNLVETIYIQDLTTMEDNLYVN